MLVSESGYSDNAAALASAALATSTVKRYRNSAANYERFCEHHNCSSGNPESLLAWLYGRRELSNSSLRLDTNAVAWRHRDGDSPGADPLVRDFLQAHARVTGTAPLVENTAAVLGAAEVGALLTATWTPDKAGGEQLIARGVGAIATWAAAGPDVDLVWVSRIRTRDVAVRKHAVSMPGASGGWIDIPRDEGRLCAYDALVTSANAAAASGSPRVFGWVVRDGSPRSAKRTMEVLRPQIEATLRRSGLDGRSNPALLAPEEVDRVLANVDPSRRMELRTRAFVATAFVTASRHSDLAHVDLPVLRSGGRIALRIGYSKTDPMGEGRTVLVDHSTGHPATCPACHLERWLAVLPEKGPVFASLGTGGAIRNAPVAVDEMNDSLRRLARGIDLATAFERLGTHTFRKSHVTIRVAQGEDAESISKTTDQTPDVIYRHYMEAGRLLSVQAQIL